MAVGVVPAALVLPAALLAVVTGSPHVSNGLSSSLAAHHGGMDTLTSQGVNVASGVTDDQHVVIKGGGQTLAAKAQGSSPHALKLGIGAQGLADEGVLLDGVIMQASQVSLLDVTAVAILATGDEVVAVVELVVGVPEDRGIARQRPLRVEANTIKVGVVGATLHEGTAAHTLRGLSAVAQLGGQLRGGTISNDQNTALHLAASGGGHSPQTSLLVELSTHNLKALLQLSTGAGSAASNAHIQVDTLHSACSSSAQLLLGGTNIGDTVGADKATGISEVGLVVVNQLLHHTHVLQNADGRGADSIAAVLVTGKLLLVQQSNLATLLGQVVGAD
mmetsp:Transcript_4947/g.10644  ORF Transcript_4947/g.10644 Transcript_4947/m.10644 type:complete len:333 (+) Transcript_4947:969-1967(+)